MTALTALEATARAASVHPLARDAHGRALFTVAFDLGDGKAHVAYTDAPAIAAPVADVAVALAGVIVRSIAGYAQHVGNGVKSPVPDAISPTMPQPTANGAHGQYGAKTVDTAPVADGGVR